MKLPQSLFRLLPAIALALAPSAIPAVALGHVGLIGSTPEAGASLDAAPTQVTLAFDGELDPAGSSFTVSDRDGTVVGRGDVDLTVADRNVLTGQVDISEAGVYTVGWQVLGADGHEIGGAFSFGYATGKDGHDSPDTAVPRPTLDPVTLVGLALLAVALAIVAKGAMAAGGRRILVR